ncbi:MAG: cytochrome c biogenesis protein CcdA [Nitrospirota bacterium]
MEAASGISSLIAFSAGFLSFVSPCVLPLLPSYVSFITGLSMDELTKGGDKARVKGIIIRNSLIFIAGFSFVFILLGASATLIGQILITYQALIRKVGGTIVVLLGFYIMGLLRMDLLSSEKKIHLEGRPAGYLGSFLVGITFAAGWTPCVGPILGGILLYASTSGSVMSGISLLSAYSIGLGLPLFITSLGVNTFITYFKKINKYIRFVSLASGLFLILVGVMIFTDSFTLITAFLAKYGIGWYIGQ